MNQRIAMKVLKGGSRRYGRGKYLKALRQLDGQDMRSLGRLVRAMEYRVKNLTRRKLP